ncbi:ATP-dependent DNA helicase RecQ-like [Saccostrea cucullata]|uniref:ATP-dependent DNA helicase RecQ-like n=1 Tax=Saccostrea cuccullata TaxID=36930 RepID=UPI002ED07CC1
MATSVENVETTFGIEKLNAFQQEAIDALMNKRDVFVGTKTGSGKTIIYQSMGVLNKEMVTVVIAPLQSIMEEQVDRLNKTGMSAIYIDSLKMPLNEIIGGKYQFIYGSPEILVDSTKWRDTFRHPVFSKKVGLLVVDEAHTILQWGESHNQEEVFRESFSRIGELRSLCPAASVLALTATASPTNRRKIMKNLCFKKNNCIIVDSPDRHNIKISVKKVKNNSEVEDDLEFIFSGLKDKGKDFPKHLIFCNTIKECSLVYSALVREFVHMNHMINMYHSKTPDDVKKTIRKDMESENGIIRVLVSTSSAGMGVNFKNLHNIVHFTPPRDMDTLVQQMGRAGRDGKQSDELILYKSHKTQMKKLDNEMMKLIISDDSCRRKIIADCYLTKKCETVVDHCCCDLCESKCKCGEMECPCRHPVFFNADNPVTEEQCTSRTRNITDDEFQLLRHKLKLLKESLDQNSTSSFVTDLETISTANIECIIKNASNLFSVEDVLQYVWSYDLAKYVHEVLIDVFDDMMTNISSSDSE